MYYINRYLEQLGIKSNISVIKFQTSCNFRAALREGGDKESQRHRLLKIANHL